MEGHFKHPHSTVHLEIIVFLFGLDMKINFTTGGWVDSVKPCTLVTITLDNNEFNIRRAEEGSPVTINGFPITAEEFDQVLFEIINILSEIMDILSESIYIEIGIMNILSEHINIMVRNIKHFVRNSKYFVKNNDSFVLKKLIFRSKY